MDSIILFIIGILLHLTLWTILISSSKPKDNLWFGVTWPKKALADEQLTRLQQEYRKSIAMYSITAFVTLLPIFLLGGFFSLAFIYLLLWTASLIYTSTAAFKRIHHRAMLLKRNNKWFVGKSRTINIGGDIERYTAMTPLSFYWFLIPAAMSILLIVLSLGNDNFLLRMTGVASLLMTGVVFAINIAFTGGRPRAYSLNPAANIAIHHAARRYWSMLWLGMAVFEAANAFIAYYVLSQGNSADPELWLGGIFVISLVPIMAIYYVHNLIRNLQYRYANTDGICYQADNDVHWRYGIHYYNKADSKVWTAKRIGAGYTVNMATAGGRMIFYGVPVLVLAILIPVTIMIVRADTSAPALAIDERGTVTIQDTSYPYTFQLDDVIEIHLEDQMPSGFKSDGIATSAYARGNFKLSELGKAKLYVFKKSPPFIVMKLDGLHIVYNEEDPEATNQLYEELKERMRMLD
ncbi:hypothetical protein M6D81_16240 [Paenibacillus sp. J5C_2022]|uniref:hypothetical protein n=1 Tax=Paenibacillus sp. J5C2022 TaxID=2977129 RepID=UPI0021CEDB7A|nr:hypothetical protein [Paenibacillus sp. J5C2022]MCU6710250.1 hypothetical protein [Paenibacillus sp. J5C2022]